MIIFASLCCDDDGNCEFSKLGLKVEHLHYSETITLINMWTELKKCVYTKCVKEDSKIIFISSTGALMIAAQVQFW